MPTKTFAEAFAEHVNGCAVALLFAGRGTPLRLDLFEVSLAANMIVDGDALVHIGHGPELCRIAVDDPVAQVVHVARQVDAIACAFQRVEHANGATRRPTGRRQCRYFPHSAGN